MRQIDSSFLVFSVVVHGRSLLMECFVFFKPVNARVLSLLNSVKYDSSLISFSAPWQVNSFLISANYFSYAVTVFILKKIVFGFAGTVSKISELFSHAATVFFPELILHKYSVEG